MKEFLSYDPDTGLFVWIKRPGKRVRAGTVAGNIGTRGYIRIRFEGKLYKAHRLAWLFTYGSFPIDQIDHINGNKADNRIKNLRDVSRSVNMQNKKHAQVNNKSTGLLGASYHKRDGSYQAQIQLDGKNKHLGHFATAEEAHERYLEVKRQIHLGNTL